MKKGSASKGEGNGMVRMSVHIKGVTPCLMHNGASADPMNAFAIERKKITSKGGNKTEADQAALIELDLKSAVYLDDEGRPCWPGENIEAGLREAGKELKQGRRNLVKKVLTGIVCPGLWPVIHPGPTRYEDLIKDDSYRDVRMVRIGKDRILRARPIFQVWELKFDLWFDNAILNEGQVRQLLEIFGKEIGLSDFRPKYGRFLVVSCEVL
jgi:hypothetical protein